jgi:hypothetical protein
MPLIAHESLAQHSEMNSLRQILAALMVALLVPASSCCVLASVMNGISFVEHHHDDFGVHSSDYHDEEHKSPAEAPDHAPTACVSELLNHSPLSLDIDLPEPSFTEQSALHQTAYFSQTTPRLLAVPIEHPSTAPPGLLLPAWHFQQRTALPARAPDLA